MTKVEINKKPRTHARGFPPGYGDPGVLDLSGWAGFVISVPESALPVPSVPARSTCAASLQELNQPRPRCAFIVHTIKKTDTRR